MMNLQRTLRIGLLCAAVILASALVLPAPHVTAGRTGAMLMQKETPTPAAEDAASPTPGEEETAAPAENDAATPTPAEEATSAPAAEDSVSPTPAEENTATPAEEATSMPTSGAAAARGAAAAPKCATA